MVNYKFSRLGAFVVVNIPSCWANWEAMDIWDKIVSASEGLLPPPALGINKKYWKNRSKAQVRRVLNLLGGPPDF